MPLTRNMSKDERVTRLFVGCLLGGGYALDIIGQWGLIGIGFVATSWINFCPFYRLIGIKTCKDC